ncbi:MAG: hypothetical protein KF821_08630 [Anaerolineales bacterium]|nr:hypothetical protein [Anaerolineales bacterium]
MQKSTSTLSPRHIGFLLALSLLYFLTLILPNHTGAQNPEMLAIFEVDEFAQYAHAVRMASGSDTLVGSLRNFVAYQHYFYGYPFYFLSALVLLPLRVLLGSGWAAHTSTLVLVLRQCISVLPNLLSVWLLTYAATGFAARLKTIVLFVLLLIVPGLLVNSLWWHADGLALLCVSLVFFCLRRDGLRFGPYFWWAAAAAGLGLGIKYSTAWFVLTIPTYLFLGLRRGRLGRGRALRLAAGFLGVMLLAFVLSNPLLLLPQERAELLATQRLQFEQTRQGILVGRPAFLEGGRLPTWLTSHYGGGAFLALLGAALLLGWARRATRPQAALLSAWLLPALFITFNASSFRPHYWLPVLLPAITALVFVLPDSLADLRRAAGWPRLLQWLVLALLGFQAAHFMRTDAGLITSTLQREQNSPSLQFYGAVQAQLAAASPAQPLRIYRDWKVYFPSRAGLEVFMDWELGSLDMLNSEQPDILLLERENVLAYGDAHYLANAPDPARLEPMHRFYRAALLHQLEGYTLMYEDAFGLMFVRPAN